MAGRAAREDSETGGAGAGPGGGCGEARGGCGEARGIRVERGFVEGEGSPMPEAGDRGEPGTQSQPDLSGNPSFGASAVRPPSSSQLPQPPACDCSAGKRNNNPASCCGWCFNKYLLNKQRAAVTVQGDRPGGAWQGADTSRRFLP